MMQAPTRPRCPQCLRALRGCICALVQPVATHAQVLILQHPLEVHEAKNTARLLHLCLGKYSRLEVGETFEAAQLQHWLHAPWQAGDASRQALLLYPPTPDLPTPPMQDAGLTARAVRLVIIDGTWRKSRKLLYANPALQALPRMALTDTAPAAYTIRKAQRDGQLSTMEAATLALEQWPADATSLQTLQQAFSRLMQQHQRLRAYQA